MGQISPLDQLISSTAFNDCSVTVIYSGVIITDVLLLCDGPSAPSPSSFCADVIVFFGTTPASFTVVLCNFCRLKFCLMHVCLGGLTPGHESRCFLTNGIVKPRVRDDRIPPPPQPPPTTDKDQPSTCQAPTLRWNLSIMYPLLPDVHTCVSVSEYACVQHVHVYGICMRMRKCVHRLSEFQCVFYPAGTHWGEPSLSPVWLLAPFISPLNSRN